MKAREERILADRKLARSGGQLEQILTACWEETLHAGPYDFGSPAVDWNKVLQGDRFYTLLQVRTLSYGPTYAFSVMCENQSCRARIEWEVERSPCRRRTFHDRSGVDRLARLQLHRLRDGGIAGLTANESLPVGVHRVISRHERVRMLRR